MLLTRETCALHSLHLRVVCGRCRGRVYIVRPCRLVGCFMLVEGVRHAGFNVKLVYRGVRPVKLGREEAVALVLAIIEGLGIRWGNGCSSAAWCGSSFVLSRWREEYPVAMGFGVAELGWSSWRPHEFLFS